jgi:predicted chitinase
MNRADFYAELRARNSGVFGTTISQSQVNGIEGLLKAFETHGDGRRNTLAYGLATAYHETGARMVPVREGFATTDEDARRAVARLAAQRGPNSPPARYGTSTPPHGHAYYGRGHVQLTWDYNYKSSSADAGVDLLKNPDAMLDPEISARVLWKGLLDGRWNGHGKGVRYYLDRNDLINARRTVNVLDKAAEIAEYHKAFESALIKAGYPEVMYMAAQKPIATPSKPVEPEGFWTRLLKLIIKRLQS